MRNDFTSQGQSQSSTVIFTCNEIPIANGSFAKLEVLMADIKAGIF